MFHMRGNFITDVCEWLWREVVLIRLERKGAGLSHEQERAQKQGGNNAGCWLIHAAPRATSVPVFLLDAMRLDAAVLDL